MTRGLRSAYTIICSNHIGNRLPPETYLLPCGMQMVAGACGVESHDGDFLFKVDGAIQSSHDRGKPGQQRPKRLLHVVLSLHLVHAQLQRVILLGWGGGTLY